jgi:hypothetical protein
MAEAGFAYDVFLSHSDKDEEVVRALAERLQADGLRVWFDEWEIKPGHSIPARIEDGLERSRVLVLAMSAHAFGSDWAESVWSVAWSGDGRHALSGSEDKMAALGCRERPLPARARRTHIQRPERGVERGRPPRLLRGVQRCHAGVGRGSDRVG